MPRGPSGAPTATSGSRCSATRCWVWRSRRTCSRCSTPNTYGAGRLTKIRAQAVSGRSCREVAERLGLPERLRTAAPPDVVRPALDALVSTERVLASVIEAVIGACYLAYGFETTAQAVREAFAPEIELALERPADFKSALQERLARRGAIVQYEVTAEFGPPHERIFEVAAVVCGRHRGRRGAGGPRRRPSRRRPPRRSRPRWRRDVHLRSITLKGFKSFPDRTKLDFSPGVSVIVGPNGSGKSNVTDAVLWAMGEQSPVAVRGQSMQDVIFAGAHGVQARGEAEVEVVLDNGDSAVDLPLSEISIVRRLNRAGEGEYRVNGAKCRLTDVLELLSDTGLGKEMHSIVSQGRVAEIVTSKPRDRRLLIEEAAGLGKHRKRRRRAQLKLDRTQDNLDRALDVEREARTRLRPLKRQAEAAELHERLERQSDEARWTLARDDARAAVSALAEAEAAVAAARAAAEATEGELREVAQRREAAEQALAARGDEREGLSNRFHAARSAHERISMRLESARQAVTTLEERAARRRAAVEELDRRGRGRRRRRRRRRAGRGARDRARTARRGPRRPARAGGRRARGAGGAPLPRRRSGWRRTRPAPRPRARTPTAPPRRRARPGASSSAPPSPPAARPRASARSSPRSTSSCAPRPARPAARRRSPTRSAPSRATSSPSRPRSARGCAPRSPQTSTRPRACSIAPAATAAPRLSRRPSGPAATRAAADHPPPRPRRRPARRVRAAGPCGGPAARPRGDDGRARRAAGRSAARRRLGRRRRRRARRGLPRDRGHPRRARVVARRARAATGAPRAARTACSPSATAATR